MVCAAALRKWPSRRSQTFGLLRCATQTKRSTTLSTWIIGRKRPLSKQKGPSTRPLPPPLREDGNGRAERKQLKRLVGAPLRYATTKRSSCKFPVIIGSKLPLSRKISAQLGHYVLNLIESKLRGKNENI
jgi:hypothetical protein